MRVAPYVQGHGFGRLILNHLELRAKQLGYSNLHLDTTGSQLAAQALYRRHGYHETGREQRERFELIFFEKRLAVTGTGDRRARAPRRPGAG